MSNVEGEEVRKGISEIIPKERDARFRMITEKERRDVHDSRAHTRK